MADEHYYLNLNIHGNFIKNAKAEDPVDDLDVANKGYADGLAVYDTQLAVDFDNTMSALGAMPAGTPVNGLTIKEILDRALFPEIPPTFTESALTASGGGVGMVGFPVTISTTITATMRDRQTPIQSMAAYAMRNPDGAYNVTVPFTGTGGPFTFPQMLAHKAMAMKVSGVFLPALPKLSSWGNPVNPPAAMGVSRTIDANIAFTALYPYFYMKIPKGMPMPDPATAAYGDLMAAGGATISPQAFCETAGATATLSFNAGEGPYNIFIALYGNVSINAKLGGSDDISSTFIKTLRVLSVPGMAGLTPQYSIFVHDTGAVPFAAPTTYVLTR